MNPLSRFYLDLCFAPYLRDRFSQGETPEEVKKNRAAMLETAGITQNRDIAMLTQPQLTSLLFADIYCITGESVKCLLKQMTEDDKIAPP